MSGKWKEPFRRNYVRLMRFYPLELSIGTQVSPKSMSTFKRRSKIAKLYLENYCKY
jgi:hypothetical protein